MNPRSHIFISYARSDGETCARELHERLESENLACWPDRLDLVGGGNFWRQLEAGISQARWVVIVLTPGALQSVWTATEWREARKRGVPVCPVWPLGAAALGEQLDRSVLPAAMRVVAEERQVGSHAFTAGEPAQASSKNGVTARPRIFLGFLAHVRLSVCKAYVRLRNF